MNLSTSIKRVLLTTFILVFGGVTTTSSAETSPETSPETLSFVLDNDVLVPGSRDQDYTGGINISYSSEQADESFLYMKAPLNALDRILKIDNQEKNIFSIEFGLYGFTPEDTQQISANNNDRPYASFVYLSSSHERINEEQSQATQSTFTVGLLGLEMFGELQNNIHRMTGSKEALGWNQQISDGGELTARYQYSRQSAIDLTKFNIKSPYFEAKLTRQLSLGYITEASFSLSGRYGRMNSAWWSFNPELSNYGERASGEIGHRGESYVFFGASVKARAYNAFLQGQFRHSEVSYNSNELNHLMAEAWLGYTHSFGSGLQLSYILRAHTSEVKNGNGDRDLLWGGIVINKSW